MWKQLSSFLKNSMSMAEKTEVNTQNNPNHGIEMSNEQKVSELPLPPEPEYLQWLKKEGFQLETSVPMETDTLVWIRKSKYGSPRCSTNGDVMIEVTKQGDLFSIGIRASTPKYWGNVGIYAFDEAQLVKLGRQYEHRVVDAWRELSA